MSTHLKDVIKERERKPCFKKKSLISARTTGSGVLAGPQHQRQRQTEQQQRRAMPPSHGSKIWTGKR